MEEKMTQAIQPCAGLVIRTGLHAGKGLGDRIADFTHATGLDKIAEYYTQATGKDCGCSQRQAWLNKICPSI